MATSQTTEMQVEGEVSVEEAVKEMLEIEVGEDKGDPFEGMNKAQVAEIYHKIKPEDQRLFRQFKRFHKIHYKTALSLSSVFAGPERILRRFYVFAEEPCKSTITTSEPCSPVFKEAQPRPSSATQVMISYKQHLEFVSACVLLLVIYCCNKASNQIVPRTKDLVFYSWIPLSPEVSRLSPYTHAQ